MRKLTEEQRKLIEAEWPYCCRVVRCFARSRGIPDDDLYGAASLGLCQAALSYDPDKGTAFRTHLVPRVRGAIQDHLREQQRRGFWWCRARRGLSPRVASLDYDYDSEYSDGSAALADLLPGPQAPIDDHLVYTDEAERLARKVGPGPAKEAMLALLTDPECTTLREASVKAGVSESRVSQVRTRLQQAVLQDRRLGRAAARHVRKQRQSA